MVMKGNNIIPNGHFHKDWQKFAKTWFDQNSRKFRRRQNRIKKARSVAPRSASHLRPIIRHPSLRYNTKIDAGRGFTLQELKAAKLNPKFAKTIGISLDHRRRNKSIESIQLNTQRLKEYMSKLIVFPINKKKMVCDFEPIQDPKIGEVLPIGQPSIKSKARLPTEEEKKFEAYTTLRKARADARLVGIRAKKFFELSENPDNVTKATEGRKKSKK